MSNADHRHSGGQMNSAQRRFVLSEGLFAWALVAPALIFILVIGNRLLFQMFDHLGSVFCDVSITRVVADITGLILTVGFPELEK